MAMYQWLGPAMGGYNKGYDEGKKRQQEEAMQNLRNQVMMEELQQKRQMNPLELQEKEMAIKQRQAMQPYEIEALKQGVTKGGLDITGKQNELNEFSANEGNRKMQREQLMQQLVAQGEELKAEQEFIKKNPDMVDQARAAKYQEGIMKLKEIQSKIDENRAQAGAVSSNAASNKAYHEALIARGNKEDSAKEAAGKMKNEATKELMTAFSDLQQLSRYDVKPEVMEMAKQRMAAARAKINLIGEADNPAAYNLKEAQAGKIEDGASGNGRSGRAATKDIVDAVKKDVYPSAPKPEDIEFLKNKIQSEEGLDFTGISPKELPSILETIEVSNRLKQLGLALDPETQRKMSNIVSRYAVRRRQVGSLLGNAGFGSTVVPDAGNVNY